MPEPALFRFDPSLARALPFTPLLDGPTPVEPLEGVVDPEISLWIKRDDRSSSIYGGNKPRKLEFLLGEALRRRARTVVTFGAAGSHHGLATALFARRLGMRAACLLVRGPLHPHAVENLKRTHRATERTLLLEPLQVPRALGVLIGLTVQDGRLPFVIPPGGSSSLGSLGYVSAALELAEQVEAGLMPRPDYLFVPVGSMGTMSGLIAGLTLARMRTTVIGVDVLGRPYTSRGKVERMVRRIVRMVRSLGSGGRKGPLEPPPFALLRQHLGRGYGHGTPEGAEAERDTRDAGVVLDPTYTAKTFAALERFAERPYNRGKTVLFWHTLSSAPVEEGTADVALGDLDRSFSRFVRTTGT